MNPTPIPDGEVPDGWRRVDWAAEQPEYATLPSIVSPDGRSWSRWEFSTDERALIAQGARLDVAQFTFGQPLQPLALSIEGGAEGTPEDYVAVLEEATQADAVQGAEDLLAERRAAEADHATEGQAAGLQRIREMLLEVIADIDSGDLFEGEIVMRASQLRRSSPTLEGTTETIPTGEYVMLFDFRLKSGQSKAEEHLRDHPAKPKSGLYLPNSPI